MTMRLIASVFVALLALTAVGAATDSASARHDTNWPCAGC